MDAKGLAVDPIDAEWQPMETCPRYEIVTLWIPEFDGFAAWSWFGTIDSNGDTRICTPLLDHDRKHVQISGIPKPLYWKPRPKPPAAIAKEPKS